MPSARATMPTCARRRASAGGAATRAASGSAPGGNGGSSPAGAISDQCAGACYVDRGVEIVAERRAERRLIAAGDADRIDGAGPRAARVRAKEAGKRARLGLEPLRGALGVGERPTGAPFRFAGRRMALLGGDRFALSGGERLGKLGDGFGARRPLRLLEAEASQLRRARARFPHIPPRGAPAGAPPPRPRRGAPGAAH